MPSGAKTDLIAEERLKIGSVPTRSAPTFDWFIVAKAAVNFTSAASICHVKALPQSLDRLSHVFDLDFGQRTSWVHRAGQYRSPEAQFPAVTPGFFS